MEVNAQEVVQVLRWTWALLCCPVRWARAIEVLESHGAFLLEEHQVLTAWSLNEAVARAAVEVSSYPLTASSAAGRVLDQLARERGYSTAAEMNEIADHNEVLNLIGEAIHACSDADVFEFDFLRGIVDAGSDPLPPDSGS